MAGFFFGVSAPTRMSSSRFGGFFAVSGFLGVGSGSQAEQTAKVMLAFEKVCVNEGPDVVIVVGDD